MLSSGREKANVFKRWGGWAFLFWTLLAFNGYGQYSQQTISLNKGWNAVYLQVLPDDARCESVFADWPVASVSLYNMDQLVARYTQSPDEPLTPDAEFMVWEPGRPVGANGFNAVLAGQSYLIFATANCKRTLTGRPAVPRINWIPCTNACNFVGFRQDGTAKFGSFLTGAGFDPNKFIVYSVSGTNSAKPTPLLVGGFGGLSTTLIEQGKAYFIACDKVSSYSGPVKVTPAGTDGIFFPTNSSYQTLRLNNDHGTSLKVTLSLTNSAVGPSGLQPVLPVLQMFDPLTGWQPLTNAVQRTLAAGEEWSLPLAVDRTGMVKDRPYGGVMVCKDEFGGRIEIPVEAQYNQPDPAHAPWPAGLWVGKASLDQVSQVLGDGSIVNGAQAGGTLELRLILHVDTDQRCRLLQRVILAGVEETNGDWNASLYVNEKKVPAGMKTVRISSVAFGLKNDMVWDETYTYKGANGGFGKALRFVYTIAADDPVNPFRHPYHPDHDGLSSDFKTKLPSGDNPQNYIPEIKPELFSISNTVSLIWSSGVTTGGGSAAWNPSEKVTGEIDFQVDGIRREGPILMKGAFVLQRISQVGALSLE